MRRILIYVVMAFVFLMTLPFFGLAQDGAPPPEAPKDIYFGGLAYDDGLSLQGGYGGPIVQNVLDGNLYAWFVVSMGLDPDVSGDDSLYKAGSGGLEASLLWGSEQLFYGLTLNAIKLDWLNIQNGGAPDWSSYLSNMIGGQVGGRIKNRLGWSAALDYSFDYTKSFFPDGPAFRVHLFLRR